MRLTDISKELNDLSAEIVGAALTVHSVLGPGLLESAYEACLAYELRELGHQAVTQVPVPVIYKGVRLDVGYRIDLLVNAAVIVEVKAVAKLLSVHEAQLLSHLRLSDHQLGLLINFHVEHLREGIRRLVNSHNGTPSRPSRPSR